MLYTIRDDKGKIKGYVAMVEDDLKPYNPTIQYEAEDEDDGDDEYACMMESLGNNWW